MYEVPSRKDIEKVVITPDVVNKVAEPQYVPRAIGSKRASKAKSLDGVDGTDEEKTA
jgi:ATP-dependent Clp protease ATP-binding subunit ClpX